MIQSQKHLFDIPDNVAYFNNAYMSPLMHKAADAMRTGIEFKAHPWTYSPEQFFTYSEQARELAGQIFEGSSENIAIIPSVSYGIQLAAKNLPVSKGQTILALKDQFPSNIYPWIEKAKDCEADLRLLDIPEDQDWTRVLCEAINADTAIVAIPHTHWSSGARIDLIKIRAALDAVGGALVLDLTQSLGAQVFDASVIRPDFAICATYKWLMGPYTLGFAYIDPRWHGGNPLEHNWINRKGSEDFAGLTHYRDEFQDGARRFDMGEKSNPAQLLGASAAFEQILAWDIKNIQATLGAKTDRIEAALKPLGFTAPKRERRADHYLGLSHPTADLADLLKYLKKHDIFVSARGPNLRITPHLYCDETDEMRLISEIKTYFRS